ncbi:hypothetical protein AAGS40_21345 [Paraburkholderia sp. PREW-6R]|uniref:hypothetical protein n=1 Tax=Paraburkholderia sp. PREW-6R TaxID=3141544 RepID=UPI0031F58198
MNAGIAEERRFQPSSDATSSRVNTFMRVGAGRCRRARRLLSARLACLLGLGALFAAYATAACAQSAGMLDKRVTQQSVSETICRSGYADSVAPPFSHVMAQKDRMLAARGIDADEAADFALDRRVPIVLGGAPDASANLGLLPWAGKQGERRKARAAVMLRRCVCEGKLSLADAQAAIVGNWSVVYSGFGQTSCDIGRLDVATGEDGDRHDRSGDHDGAP